MPSMESTYRFKLSRILEQMSDLFAVKLAQMGMTPKHYGLLLAVYKAPNMTQRDVAGFLKIDRSTTGKLVDMLEEKGFLKRNDHPTDRRAYVLALTPAGAEIVLQLWQSLVLSEQSALYGLSEDEISTFSRLLNKILENKKEK